MLGSEQLERLLMLGEMSNEEWTLINPVVSKMDAFDVADLEDDGDDDELGWAPEC